MTVGVFFIPGHNNPGKDMRYTAAKLAGWFYGLQVHVMRFERETYKDGILVTTPSEELRQAKIALERFGETVQTLIVAGHSQGAGIALRLADDGLADGYVSVMGDYDTKFDIAYHLKKIGSTLPKVKKKPVRWEKDNGKVYWYKADFFEDYKTWDLKKMIKNLDCPALFIAGTQDDILTPKAIKNAATWAKHGAYAEVVSGHRFGARTMLRILRIIRKWSDWN